MRRHADRLLFVTLTALVGCGLKLDDRTTGPTAEPTVSSSAATTPSAGVSSVASTDESTVAPATETTGAVTSGAQSTPPSTLPGTPAPTPFPTASPTTSADPRPLAIDLLALVRVEREHRGGYDRELFGYPTSFGGGCDTRDEVLMRDSLSPVQMDPIGCTVVAGDWYSPYDDLMFETPQDIEIDHVVALKEAWDSGAWQWGPAALEAFANDVTDPRTLRAVSGDSNRDKSDKDPSNWLPLNAGDVCRFVGDWTAIKVRWGLSMDESEYGRVRNLLRGVCEGWRIEPIAPTPVPLP